MPIFKGISVFKSHHALCCGDSLFSLRKLIVPAFWSRVMAAILLFDRLWILFLLLNNRIACLDIPEKQHNRPEGTACRSASNGMPPDE